MDNVHFSKGEHAIPLLDVGLMQSATYLFEFKEVHILYAFWNTIGAHSLQGWITS
jgi:hypothetical protein